MEVDIVTQTYQDIEGNPHYVDPLYYLHLVDGFNTSSGNTTEALKQLAKRPKEQVEIREKYKKIAKAKGDHKQKIPSNIAAIGSGKQVVPVKKQLGRNVPQFHFNPLKTNRKAIAKR